MVNYFFLGITCKRMKHLNALVFVPVFLSGYNSGTKTVRSIDLVSTKTSLDDVTPLKKHNFKR